MADAFTYGIVLAAGFAMGIVFFGGLWYTVRSLPGSQHPVLLTLASFWVRMLLVMGGFLVAMDRRWERATVCLVGFLLARLLLSCWIPAPDSGRKGDD